MKEREIILSPSQEKGVNPELKSDLPSSPSRERSKSGINERYSSL